MTKNHLDSHLDSLILLILISRDLSNVCVHLYVVKWRWNLIGRTWVHLLYEVFWIRFSWYYISQLQTILRSCVTRHLNVLSAVKFLERVIWPERLGELTLNDINKIHFFLPEWAVQSWWRIVSNWIPIAYIGRLDISRDHKLVSCLIRENKARNYEKIKVYSIQRSLWSRKKTKH